jgi:hypothetical protein
MIKLLTVSLLMLGFMMIAPNLSAQASCVPYGSPNGVGPVVGGFNYVANGSPSGADCWSMYNAWFTPTAMNCSTYTSNAFEFSYAGDVEQLIAIPATDTNINYYQLSYILDFQDPYHDPAFDQINVQVWDQTTNSVLASDHYDGSQADLFCVHRDLPLITGNKAGHQIYIRFQGSAASDSVHVRIADVGFWGNP